MLCYNFSVVAVDAVVVVVVVVVVAVIAVVAVVAVVYSKTAANSQSPLLKSYRNWPYPILPQEIKGLDS